MDKNNIKELYSKYKKKRNTSYIKRLGLTENDIYPDYKKKLGIIVPYRDNLQQDRKSQLEKFIIHTNNIFADKNWKLYVIEQSNDGKKFNRGALLNIGIQIALNDKCEILVTHDVDLLPHKKLIPYYFLYSIYHPIHIGHVWQDKYKYWEFVGGILSMSDILVKKINGYPNNFWGWGGEDDAIYNRLLSYNIQIYEPNGMDGAIEELKHVNTSDIKEFVNMKKKENILKDILYWKSNGLNSIKYTLLKKNNNIYSVEIK
jgi:hypothetical protein